MGLSEMTASFSNLSEAIGSAAVAEQDALEAKRTAVP
jgi:hypothetical protein